MAKLATVLGLFIVLMSLVAAAAPETLFSAMDWESRDAKFFAAGARLVFGVVLLLAAANARLPRGLRVVGWLFLASAAFVALLPMEGWVQLVNYWTVENVTAYRIGGSLLGLLLGGFITYASLPREWRRLADER
jgi:hypothetical protein